MEVAQVDVEVDAAIFGPGVDGDMAFAEADDGGETGGVEVMIDFAEFCEVMGGDPGVEGLLKAFGRLQERPLRSG